jgi:hypothetical protein
MTIDSLRDWGGMLTVLVGALLVLFGVLPTLFLPTSDPLLQWVLDPDWSWLNGLALIMTVLTPLALTSIYLEQVEGAGRLGFVGFVMAFLGSMLFSSVQFDEAFLWPILAAEAPGFLDPVGPMLTDPGFSTVYLLMGMLFILGFILFGIATLRANVFPRAAAVLLIMGVPLFAGGMFFPPLVRAAGALLAGAGLIWMGVRSMGLAGESEAAPAF